MPLSQVPVVPPVLRMVYLMCGFDYFTLLKAGVLSLECTSELPRRLVQMWAAGSPSGSF